MGKLNENTPGFDPMNPKIKDLGRRDIGTDYGMLKKAALDQIAKLEKAFTNFEQRMMDVNNEIRNRVGDLGSGHVMAKHQIGKLSRELDSLRSTYEEQKQKSQETIEQLRSDLTAKEKKISELQHELAAKGEDAGEKAERIGKLQQDMEAALDRASNAEAKVQQAEAKIAELEQQVSKLTGDSDADAQLIQKLQGTYKSVRDELAQANSELVQQYNDLAKQYNELLSSLRTNSTVGDEMGESLRKQVNNLREWGKFDLREHLERSYRR